MSASPSLNAEFRSLPRDGETHNGDAGFVRLEAVTWLAVIDGLGHGEQAALATAKGMAALHETATANADLSTVMRAMDSAMWGSRGAGAMVCRIEGDRLSGCSVGNIGLRCTSSDLGVLMTPGILGRQIRRFRVFGAALPPGCRIMMFSDGIRRTATLRAVAKLGLSAACDEIVARHRDPADDSTVLIADAAS